MPAKGTKKQNVRRKLAKQNVFVEQPTQTAIPLSIIEDQDEFGLTMKQHKFCEAWIANNGNGTDAARKAGYEGDDNSLAVQSYENLRKPNIQSYILMRYRQSVMTADEALYRLSAFGRGNITDFLDLSIEDLKKHPQAFLIKKLELDIAFPVEGEGGKPTPFVKRIELHDPRASIVNVLEQMRLVSGLTSEIQILLPTLNELVDVLKTKGASPVEVFQRMLVRAKAES